MAEWQGPRRRSSSNGSQHSSQGSGFGSRPSSMRRKQRGYTYTNSNTQETAASVFPDELLERQISTNGFDSKQQQHILQEEMTAYSTCQHVASAPYLVNFCLPIESRDFDAAMPSGDLQNGIEELLKAINAFWNEGEGAVCVHFSVAIPIVLLDESIDCKLMGLIPNGTTYDDNFERLVQDERHVLYRVKPRADRVPCALSFPSFLPSNARLFPPNQQQVQTLAHRCATMQQPSSVSSLPPPDEGIEFVQDRYVNVYPSCRVFLRQLDFAAVGKKTDGSFEDKLVSYVWVDLELPKYVAALCKNESGGSVFLGIAEEKEEPRKKWREVEGCSLGALFPGSSKKVWEDAGGAQSGHSKVYHLAKAEDVPRTDGRPTGRYICQGVQLTPQQRKALETSILNKTHADMLWYPQCPERQPLSVRFHTVRGGPRDRCVVEVEVSSFAGVAFHEATGPEAYCVQQGECGPQVRRLSPREFMEKVRSLTLPLNDTYGDSVV